MVANQNVFNTERIEALSIEVTAGIALLYTEKALAQRKPFKNT